VKTDLTLHVHFVRSKIDWVKVPLNHEVLAELHTICRSECFARVTTGKKLLRYLVKATLADAERKPTIKGVTIGMEVFGLPGDFDPKKNTIVKVSVRDLRDKLEEYYENEGRRDRVAFRIRVGSYIPEFTFNPATVVFDLDYKTLDLISDARTALAGRSWWNNVEVETCLEKALKQYPNHPKLLSLLAMIRVSMAEASSCGAGRRALMRAASIIAKIRSQGIEQWECSLTDGWINATLHWDWDRAAGLFARANVFSAGEAGACQPWLSWFLASQLHFKEAEAILEDALLRAAYDNNFTRAELAFIQILAGRLDEAEATLRLIEHVSGSEESDRFAYLPTPYGQTALLNAARGDFEKAAHVLKYVPESHYRHALTLGLQCLFTGLAGRGQRAQEDYATLISKYTESGALPFALAASGAGDNDAAVKWFTKAAVSERDPFMILIAVVPLTRHLRQHLGFRALVTQTMKLRFPPEP
jgi:tetratricopeptide (TPR) repeat protein